MARNWEKDWNGSEAKKILEHHLESDTLPVDSKTMSARDAWNEMYGKRAEFGGMELNFFQKKLSYLRQKWKKKKGIGCIQDWEGSVAKVTLERDFNDKLPAAEKEMSAKEAWEKFYRDSKEWEGASYGFFSEKLRALRRKWERRDAMDWRASAARLVILYDLEDKVLTDDEDELPAEEAWDLIYNKMEEFEGVPFWQFKEKLHDHRQQYKISANKSLEEDLILADDLALHLTTIHNERGELKFYLTKAKALLRADIEKNLHERLTATEFQFTRTEYHQFKPRKFRERIRQEIRYQNFFNYLEDKRKAKLAEVREKEIKKKKKTK
jgi:hypothetical protein